MTRGSMVAICASGSLLVAGCLSLRPQTADDSRAAPSAHSTPTFEAVEGTAAQGTAARSPRGGKAEHWQIDPDVPFPPPPAEGITGIAVPNLLVEPAATYLAAPSPTTGPIRAVDVPTPKSLRPEPSEDGRPEAHEGRSEGPHDAPGAGRREAVEPRHDVDPRPAGATLEPLAPPPLVTTFDSTDFSDNATLTGSLFIPPDPIAAAGPNHVVDVVNVTMAIYQKNGTQDLQTSLADFFASLSPLTFTFDPKVVYDHYAGRFVIVTLEQTDTGAGGAADTSRIFLAVSDDSDPNGTWFMTEIDSKLNIVGTERWADYPGFAVDEQAVYLTANMFGFLATGQQFGGSRLWVIDKGLGAGGFYDGGLATVNLLDPYASPPAIATTTQPAQMYGVSAGGVATYLTSYSGLSDPMTEQEFVQVIELTDPLGTPTFSQEFVPVGDLEDLMPPMPLPGAPQMGTSHLIATNDRRALNSVWLDDGLWMVASIVPKPGDPDAGEVVAHWWRLDTTLGMVAGLADQGSILGEDIETDTFTFFPSVAINGAGDIAFGYSASGAAIFPGAYYTTRDATDPPGTTTGSGELRDGLASYRRTFQCVGTSRWGDYTGVATDPRDGSFWVFNEYALTTGQPTGECEPPAGPDEDGRWGTAYGQLAPAGACPADMNLANETLSGSHVLEAASSIRTFENVGLAIGSNITMRARDRVIFANGLTVRGNLAVELTTAPCS